LRITRRQFCESSAKLAALVAAAGAFPSLSLVAPAYAQTPSNEELMTAGPLGEKVLGDPNAPVVMIEYAAVTCSHCGNFYRTVYPTLKSRYIDTGKVRFIFREFPLNPLDEAGFMLARCAGDDKYFAMIDALFERQSEWVVQRPLQPLLAIAKQAGFTPESFEACLSNQKVQEGVRWVRDRANEKFGVNSTPTFFINGKIYRGELTVDQLDNQIKAYLKS
jgi:protein-disulfide isomerase